MGLYVFQKKFDMSGKSEAQYHHVGRGHGTGRGVRTTRFRRPRGAPRRRKTARGIPPARNRQGGHGAGTLPDNQPPAELVSYILHMTATTILFLTEAEKKLV